MSYKFLENNILPFPQLFQVIVSVFFSCLNFFFFNHAFLSYAQTFQTILRRPKYTSLCSSLKMNNVLSLLMNVTTANYGIAFEKKTRLEFYSKMNIMVRTNSLFCFFKFGRSGAFSKKNGRCRTSSPRISSAIFFLSQKNTCLGSHEITRTLNFFLNHINY